MKRFTDKIKKDANGCWTWVASINATGYGQFKFNKKMLLAHRFSYALFIEEIPEKMYVCHKCDNRKCVNPEHLFLGTAQDNILDCINKKRRNTPYGVNHHKSKLSVEDVLYIRKYPKNKGYMKELANKFNVRPSNISHIIHRRLWRHI